MIEDCSANLNQAKVLGMKTILVQNGEQLTGFDLQVDSAASAAEVVWQWTQDPGLSKKRGLPLELQI